MSQWPQPPFTLKGAMSSKCLQQLYNSTLCLPSKATCFVPERFGALRDPRQFLSRTRSGKTGQAQNASTLWTMLSFAPLKIIHSLVLKTVTCWGGSHHVTCLSWPFSWVELLALWPHGDKQMSVFVLLGDESGEPFFPLQWVWQAGLCTVTCSH